MANSHKQDFIDLYNKKINEHYNFFIEKSISINNKEFRYLICNIDMEILKCALSLAKEKTNYTMDLNQASIPRDYITKIKKCSQGILAEMFIHFLLIERYHLNVLRYDLERDSFVYNPEEYDLKVVTSNKDYEIESRSSNIHHTSIEKFVTTDVIIGPYVNKIKSKDDLADFHFRPIYMPEFEPFEYHDGKLIISNKFFENKINLVITGVATKDDFINNGYTASLGQWGTKYNVVSASLIGDIITMDQKFNDIFE